MPCSQEYKIEEESYVQPDYHREYRVIDSTLSRRRYGSLSYLDKSYNLLVHRVRREVTVFLFFAKFDNVCKSVQNLSDERLDY